MAHRNQNSKRAVAEKSPTEVKNDSLVGSGIGNSQKFITQIYSDSTESKVSLKMLG